MNLVEARQKLRALPSSEPKTAEVGNLLLAMGLELIACGDDTIVKDGHSNDIGQVDLIFLDKELGLYFLIEVSVQRQNRSEKILTFFTKWKNARNYGLLKSKVSLSSSYKAVSIYFDITNHSEVPPPVASHLLTSNDFVLLEDDLNYFIDAFEKVGKWAKSDFLSFLQIKPRTPRAIDVPGLQFFIGSTVAYLYVDKVENLLKYSYVSRRLKNENGYQRILDKGRIGAIAKKIRTTDILAFPNTILLSCPEDVEICNSLHDLSDGPQPVTLKMPNDFCRLKIIDGQHRLLGFSKVEDDYHQQTLPVIVLKDLDRVSEVKTFIDINSSQKKIDQNLILLLKADQNWDRSTNPEEYVQKLAVNIVKRLNNESVLRNKIFIPHALARKKGQITLATLVSAILSNKLLSEEGSNIEHKVFVELRDVFQWMNSYMPSYSGNAGSFFLSNKGIRVIFRLLNIFNRNIQTEKIAGVTFEDVIKALKVLINPLFIKRIDKFYGVGGANQATELILKELKKRKKFQNLELDLRKLNKTAR